MRNFLSKYIKKRDYFFIFFTILLGSLCHFIYDWSGGFALAALFCPVNEYTWEHLKLLYFPFFLATFWYSRRYKGEPARFFYARFLGAVCGLLSIIVLFYTYTGITGQSFLVVDILIFCLSVLTAFLMSSYFYQNIHFVPSLTSALFLWTVFSFAFFIFTCYPLNLPLFFPPDIV